MQYVHDSNNIFGVIQHYPMGCSEGLGCGDTRTATLVPGDSYFFETIVPASTGLANYSGWYHVDACQSGQDVNLEYQGTTYRMSGTCDSTTTGGNSSTLKQLKLPGPILGGDVLQIYTSIPVRI